MCSSFTGPAASHSPGQAGFESAKATSPRVFPAKPLNSAAAANGLRTGGKQVQKAQEGGQAGEGEKQ